MQLSVYRVDQFARFLKALTFFLIVFVFTPFFVYLGLKLTKQSPTLIPDQLVFTVPQRSATYQGIGSGYEPIIPVKIKLPYGYEKYEFLLDSGATISSLPFEMLEKMNLDPVSMPRVAFTGYGNSTTFAYQGNVSVKIGEKEDSLPVVFTEVRGSRMLLGRKGFFERYTIYFIHKNNTIEIRG